MSPSFSVQLSPPVRDQHFSFSGHFVPNPATHFTTQKNERGIRPKFKKTRKSTVLNKQKRTICVFKCWLNCQLASFEALLSLAKPINDPTQSWSVVPFFASCRTKRYPSKLGIYFVFSYHIGQTCPVKEFWWSRNGAFFENKKKRPRRTSHGQCRHTPLGSVLTRRCSEGPAPIMRRQIRGPITSEEEGSSAPSE